MRHLALRRLIGATLVDREVYYGLMNGERSALMDEFNLSDQERQVLASVDASSARDLASTVHTWLKEQGGSIPPSVNGSLARIL